VTVIVSSHLLGELEAMIDDVVIVSQGRIVRSEPVGIAQTDACEVQVNDSARLLAAAAQRGIPATQRGGLIQLGTSAADAVRVAVDIGVDVLSAGPAGRSLEALYEEVSTAEFESGVVR
jgi:ABC-2 type transport system ATP-binding protein